MNIILCGESWMRGSYDIPHVMEPSDPGLMFLLQQQGHSVVNLSVQGGSNELQILILERFLRKQSTFLPDLLIFMQCSLTRRYRDYGQEMFRRNESFEKSKKRRNSSDI